MKPWASFWDPNTSSVDYTMSANKQTAYRVGTTVSGYAVAKSSPSGTGDVYVEVTMGPTGNNTHVGIANINAPVSTGQFPGAETNAVSWSNDGNIYVAGAPGVPSGIGNFNPGDVVAIAVWGQLQLVQFRQVTQNSAWSNLFPLVSVGKPPYLLVISSDTGSATAAPDAYANFYGPFVSTPPTATISALGNTPATASNPTFTAWNPEALFSEQPVKVIDFDAVLTDGSYTSDNLQDLSPIPFSYVKWGDAVLDAQANLVFTDWVWGDENAADSDHDWPLFTIVIQVAGPANNWLWAAWDYGTPFVFDKVHIPDANSVAISNIQIPPPPATNPFVGQGHVLQIFSSCDTSVVFTWTQGRVYGTENVLVWEPIEYATFPPSVVGTKQPVIANSIQGGSFGPPIGPPL